MVDRRLSSRHLGIKPFLPCQHSELLCTNYSDHLPYKSAGTGFSKLQSDTQNNIIKEPASHFHYLTRISCDHSSYPPTLLMSLIIVHRHKFPSHR
jgi:hypothetical protein